LEEVAVGLGPSLLQGWYLSLLLSLHSLPGSISQLYVDLNILPTWDSDHDDSE
jgi:hypothetical protein